jgi:transposase
MKGELVAAITSGLFFTQIQELNVTTNSHCQDTPNEARLHMALELSSSKWKLGFSDVVGRRPRIRTIDAGNLGALEDEIKLAKKCFRMDEDTRVSSCYEAGRDGFWIHRCLVSMGIDNHIVEPASIEVSRKKRRAKTDRIDVEKILSALMRHLSGEKYACRMIRIPDADQEDARNLNRELETLKSEKTSHTNRIRGLLAAQGITGVLIDRHFPKRLSLASTADGRPLNDHLKARLEREFERLALAVDQIRALQMQQVAMLREAAKAEREAEMADRRRVLKQSYGDRIAATAYQLSQLSGIGMVTSWTLSAEIFAWRDIKNRRQLAALAGLTPTPYASGEEEKEQGISKSGRAELRSLMIEIAWGWLLFQPQSDLAKWYRRRFDDGTRRNKKRGIVALARKLLVALGKYVRDGEIPAGARLGESHSSYHISLRLPATAAAA